MASHHPRRLSVRSLSIISTLVLLAVFISAQPAAADTRYVGDELIITLRMGKSTNHKIIKTLKTGTPLEVLEEGEEYLKVRTPDGSEGYVLSQYVSSNLPKALRIQELERLNSSLRKKIDILETSTANQQQELSNLRLKSTELEKNQEEAIANEQSLSEKYNTLLAQSENVIELTAERDRLFQQNSNMKQELATLAEKNEKLSDSRMVKWFLAGGGVLFFGWIIGRISRKKRSRF